MGYTTDFTGSFLIDRPLEPQHADYLRAFASTRRMKRNPVIAASLPDPVREAAGLGIGADGGFFVGSTENYGQNDDASVVEHNSAPGQIGMNVDMEFSKKWNENRKLITDGLAQPGLWCQWTVAENNQAIEWDEGEKFYNYIPWIKYLIANFLAPWGYKLNGTVEWEGEENGDAGRIIITDNVVKSERKEYYYKED